MAHSFMYLCSLDSRPCRFRVHNYNSSKRDWKDGLIRLVFRSELISWFYIKSSHDFLEAAYRYEVEDGKNRGTGNEITGVCLLICDSGTPSVTGRASAGSHFEFETMLSDPDHLEEMTG